MRTVFTNAAFHTMESADDVRESLTVERGVIVGFDESPRPRDQVVDLHGAHVFPALIDAHLHMAESIALAALGVPLCRFEHSGVEPHTLTGIEAAVRTHRANMSPSQLTVFTTYVSAAMDEGRLPTRYELDAWSNDGMVYVLNIDGHSSACSSALLAAVGLEAVAEDGVLAGEAHDANIGAITAHLTSSVTPALLARGIAAFCNECASFGIGTVCALEGTENAAGEADRLTPLMARLARRFPQDVRLFPQFMTDTALESVRKFMAVPRAGGCMKWELDGSVGSRTAAFHEPYRDGTQGSLYFDTATLEEVAARLAGRGYTLSAHAIGEAAIDQALDVLERTPGRHRIDHCEFPSPRAVERLKALSPFVTVQPGYAWIDARYLHGYERYLPEHLVNQQLPLRDLAEGGVVLCGSSDSPVQSADPYLQMRGMREFHRPDQALSAYEALKTYAVNGGVMLGERKGLLREGYEASFFALRDNLLDMPVENLENLRAEATYLHGTRYRPLPPTLAVFARLARTRPRAL